MKTPIEYRFDLWVPLVFVALGLASAIFTVIHYRDRSSQMRVAMLFLVTFLFWGVAAPTFFLQRVKVTESEIVDVKGLWFLPREHVFKIDPIESLEILIPAADKIKQQWVFKMTDGQRRIYQPSGLWQEHTEEITGMLKKKGVTVTTVTAEG